MTIEDEERRGNENEVGIRDVQKSTVLVVCSFSSLCGSFAIRF